MNLICIKHFLKWVRAQVKVSSKAQKTNFCITRHRILLAKSLSAVFTRSMLKGYQSNMSFLRHQIKFRVKVMSVQVSKRLQKLRLTRSALGSPAERAALGGVNITPC